MCGGVILWVSLVKLACCIHHPTNLPGKGAPLSSKAQQYAAASENVISIFEFQEVGYLVLFRTMQ